MPTRFVFLILPEVHLLDLAGPDQTIHEAMDYGADFEISYCSINVSLTTTAGLSLTSPQHFSEVEFQSGDYLVIPGARVDRVLSADFRSRKDLFDWIVDRHQSGVNIVSICAGSFVLGLCGLLDGRECTTHFKRTGQLQEMFPKATVIENRLFTEDNGVFTSAGIASGIDLTLHIIEGLTDSYFAHKVAREMVVYNRRSGSNEQHSVFMEFRNHIHTGIHKAQDFIIEHIDQKHYLVNLAELACMSERNFTRIFKQETGVTINQYINLVRKEVVQQLGKNPDLTKSQLARRVGLDSERQLSRLMTS